MALKPCPQAAIRPRRWSRRFGLLILLSWAMVCLFPFAWVVISSFKAAADFVEGPRYIPLIDFWPRLDAWQTILVDEGGETFRRFASSTVVAVSTTGLALLVGGVTSFALLHGRGRRSHERLLVVLLATRILPPVATVIPIYVMIERLGAVDTWSALAAVHTLSNLPLAIWLLLEGFRRLPHDVIDAAELDGASFFRLFFTMAVPLARSSVVATGLLIFVLSWNEYTFAIYLTTDHALTLPPFLAGQMAVREQMASAEPQWSYFSVLIVLMVTPLVLCAGIVSRLASRTLVRQDLHNGPRPS